MLSRGISRLKINFLKVLHLLCVLFLLGCGPKPTPNGSPNSPATKPIGDTLTLTIVPYEAAEKLQEEYQPMADYLAAKMGVPKGKYISINDYAGVIAALQTGQVDVVYLSSFPYALATSKMKLH